MINFAIIGCGRIAKKHKEAIINTEGANLYAVCDLNEDKAKKLREDLSDTKVFTDYKELLEDEYVDVFNICTDHIPHTQVGIDAMNAGKHVMIEKPIAINLSDADKLIETQKKTGVKATAVHQNRFNDVVQKTRKAVEENKFGEFSHGVASIRWNRNEQYYGLNQWRGSEEQKDGILMNQCIHNIDLLTWMMGPVKKVTGITKTRFRDIEMEDVAVATLEFESGAIGTIEGAGTIHPTNLEETLNLFGEKGTVMLGGIAVNKIEAWRFNENFQEEEISMLEEQENPTDVYGFGHQRIVEDMVDSINNDREPYITLNDGKNALEIILAIYESSKLGGKPVYLKEFREGMILE
ncbi:Gfo/Idh/MocA family protein [Aquisalibacillus elongatus]|uniref:Putative dehydrogenase n=1 Tax=Aquisalibacillus elongatus TaxID=485577 RepID=A0A3N5CBI5_9BACI|nr:Gfo/Idh/MocA family oxidoreductase [Aquisalibacillus elongatus]RPF54201.1 putative dehydrogenase [Aquisalibacillus elongatus]